MKITTNLHKQPSGGILVNRCCKNMQQTYSRTPMPKCDFRSNFIEIAFQLGFSPNLKHIFRTPLLQNTPEVLLLNLRIPIEIKKHQQLTSIIVNAVYHCKLTWRSLLRVAISYSSNSYLKSSHWNYHLCIAVKKKIPGKLLHSYSLLDASVLRKQYFTDS